MSRSTGWTLGVRRLPGRSCSLTGRHPLTDAAQASIEKRWLAQVGRACGSVLAVTPELPPQPWRPTWLFQLWWNTLGPGARTWLRTGVRRSDTRANDAVGVMKNRLLEAQRPVAPRDGAEGAAEA